MAIDYEIFEGKSLSSLFKDIYDNTEYNKKQLDILTKELVQFIKAETAASLPYSGDIMIYAPTVLQSAQSNL